MIFVFYKNHMLRTLSLSSGKMNGVVSFFFHPGSSNSKGQIILINEKVLLDYPPLILHSDERILAIDVSIDGTRYFIINIYAPNKKHEKNIFFNKLETFLNSLDSQVNTFIGGDYNTILDIKKDLISGLPHDKKEIQLFQSLLSNLDLYDTWRHINPNTKDFTWSKRNPNSSRRLDYVLCNNSVLPKISKVTHIHMSCTDHKGVLAEFENNDFKKGPSIWHFNNSLLKDKAYIEFITGKIEDYNGVSNNNITSYQRHWELLKADIKAYTIQYCTKKNILMKNKETNLNKEIERISSHMITNPDCPILKNQYSKLKFEQEVIDLHKTRGAQIRSKVKHIEESERNTKYFLGVEKSRANNKNIYELNSANGPIKEPVSILSSIKDFYSNMFAFDNTVDDSISGLQSFLLGTEYPVISNDEKEICEENISISELSSVLKTLNDNSVAGSDGLTAPFYKFLLG